MGDIMSYCKNKKQCPVKPVGGTILLELLTDNEVLDSKIIIPEKVKKNTLQGIVLAVGPALKLDEFGLMIGDRVLTDVGLTPVPKPKNWTCERNLVIAQAHNIKCVLDRFENCKNVKCNDDNDENCENPDYCHTIVS
jgi:co-chaperonin GroES (HSP10)